MFTISYLFLRRHGQNTTYYAAELLEAGGAIANAVGRRLPTAAAGFVVNKVTVGRFSSSTSVSPANTHSTKYSIIIYHPGLVQ
jgi:hypothetical protein